MKAAIAESNGDISRVIEGSEKSIKAQILEPGQTLIIEGDSLKGSETVESIPKRPGVYDGTTIEERPEKYNASKWAKDFENGSFSTTDEALTKLAEALK